MDDARPLSPYIPFCGKIGHPSREVAIANLRRQRRYLIAKSKELGNFHIYKCSHCTLYHAGNTTDAAPTAPASKPRTRRESDTLRRTLRYDPDD